MYMYILVLIICSSVYNPLFNDQYIYTYMYMYVTVNEQKRHFENAQCLLSEVASGGFWGPRRLVAEMLLHVEINLP